jgi:peroxiredoxin Q/BCP
VQVFGVSFDSVDDNAKFAEKFRFNFPLLCDTGRAIGMAYGACDEPQAGTARRISYLIGPDGRIRSAYARVKPAEHPQEVLKDL